MIPRVVLEERSVRRAVRPVRPALRVRDPAAQEEVLVRREQRVDIWRQQRTSILVRVDYKRYRHRKIQYICVLDRQLHL